MSATRTDRPGAWLRVWWAERRRRNAEEAAERSIISFQDRKARHVRWAITIGGGVILLGLAILSVGPVFWLFKSATSTSLEVITEPFSLWPSGLHWDNFTEAFRRVRYGTYMTNTLWLALGTWFFSLLVTTTGAYGLAILKPKYARPIEAMILATLFIPGVVTLVALYLTVIDLPLLNINLLNTFWAVWLPASANAFNLLLMQRSFASLPRELFEAARIDGAGPFRIFWSLVLPMSKPIIGVVSLLVLVAAYKDFLWPLLALPSSDMWPISVALPRLEGATELSVYMAALFMSLVPPVVLFLLFQKQFLSAAGSSGALKE